MNERSKLRWSFRIVGVVVCASLGWAIVSHAAQMSTALDDDGVEYAFNLSRSADPFLNEHTALSIARDALTRDQLNAGYFTPIRDTATVAPDGTADRFFRRQHDDPSAGQFTFVGDDGGVVLVDLRRSEEIVRCLVRRRR